MGAQERTDRTEWQRLTIEFGHVAKGSLFLYEFDEKVSQEKVQCFIKLQNKYRRFNLSTQKSRSEENYINAVDIKTGKGYWFMTDTPVIKIKVDMAITKMGSYKW